MVYKDMTFCEYKDCVKFEQCIRALTKKVEEDARRWWGNKNAPFSVFFRKTRLLQKLKNSGFGSTGVN